MEIEDFLVDKINSLQEEEFFNENDENDTEVDSIFTWERLQSAQNSGSKIESQNLRSTNLKPVVLNTKIRREELKKINIKDESKANTLSKNLIKIASLGFITLTIGTLLYSLMIDNSNTKARKDIVVEKLLETVEEGEEESDLEESDFVEFVVDKSLSPYSLDSGDEDVVEPSLENPPKIDNEDVVEPSLEIQKSKKSAKDKIEIQSETYKYVMQNEDIQLFSGKKLSSIPKWDKTQWSVGYGVCVYGYNAKRGVESEKPWKDKNGNVVDWVDNLRKAYGNIPAGPGDRSPTESDIGAIGEQTSKKAMIYFIIKNTNDGFKNHIDVWKHAPEQLRKVLVDLLHNMGVNTLNKFPKMIKALRQVLSVYRHKKQNTQEGKLKIKKYMKKVAFELTRGNNSNEASDYFFESHWKKVKKRIEKRKSRIERYKNNIKKYELKAKRYKNNKKLLGKAVYNLNLNKSNLEEAMRQVNDTRVARNISVLYEIAGIPKKAAISFLESVRKRITGKNGKKIEKEIKNESILREYIYNLIT